MLPRCYGGRRQTVNQPWSCGRGHVDPACAMDRPASRNCRSLAAMEPQQKARADDRLRSICSLFLLFSPSRCSEDRLQPFRQADWGCTRRRQHRGKPHYNNRATGAFRVAGTRSGRNDLTPPVRDDGARRPWRLDDPALLEALGQSGLRRVLIQREVCSGAVIVDEVLAQQAPEMGFVQHHEMVEALAAERADDPFPVRILPSGPSAAGPWSAPVRSTPAGRARCRDA